MTLPVPVVWSEDCLRHEPGGEVWLGVRDEGTEVPARALVLRDALTAAGAPVLAAVQHGDPATRHRDQSLLLHLPERQGDRLPGRPDQPGQLLVRQPQADLPPAADRPPVRPEQVQQHGHRPLPVRPEQQVLIVLVCQEQPHSQAEAQTLHR